MTKRIKRKYLIEYSIGYDNSKDIGKDEIFSGEGLFYLKTKNKTEAKEKAKRKIQKMFSRKFSKQITRVELA